MNGEKQKKYTQSVAVMVLLFLATAFSFDVVSASPPDRSTMTDLLAMQDSRLSLHIKENSAGAVEVSLTSAVDEKFEYFVLSDPGRFVLDFDSSHKTFPAKIHNLQTKRLQVVRVGHGGEKTRVVLEFQSKNSPLLRVGSDADRSVFLLPPTRDEMQMIRQREPGSLFPPRVFRVRSILGSSKIPVVRSFTHILNSSSQNLEKRFRVQDRHLVRAPGLNATSPSSDRLQDQMQSVVRQRQKFEVKPERVAVRAYEKKDILIENRSEGRLRLTARIVEIFQAGTQQEHFSQSSDVSVSPVELSLKKGAAGRFEIWISASAPRTERFFELQVIPLGASQLEKGIGVPIFIQPEERLMSVHWERRSDVIAIENTGNVSVLLKEGRFCKPGSEHCESLTPFRLYPGNNVGIALPDAYSVHYDGEYSGTAVALKIPSGVGEGGV